MFNNIPAFDFSAFGAPVQNIVDLNTATLTKVFEAQQAASKSLMDLSQARAKAALEIKDINGLVTFVKEQGDLTKASILELSDNTLLAVKNTEAYLADIQKEVAKVAPIFKSAA